MCIATATEKGSFLSGGKIIAGQEYMIDNLHIFCGEAVEIHDPIKKYIYYGIGDLSWFENLIDIRPDEMKKKNLW